LGTETSIQDTTWVVNRADRGGIVLSVILSCGCKAIDSGIEAEWDTISREGKPAIECGFICQKHFEIYDARTSEPETKLKDKNT
jgi:hypothetical protein